LRHNRICFTFQRGFGNAVAKNRAKRLSREAFKKMKNRIYSGYDLILLIFPETEATLSERMKQLDSLYSKAGLLVS
jgi:ribonuclease P protein component